MARSVNKVILVGNLGRDAETKFTPGGRSRTTFTVATSRSWKDAQTGETKEQTDWHNIVLWGSEKIAEYLTKGKTVYVEGRLTTRSYETNEGKTAYVTEVVCENIVLLSGDRSEKAQERQISARASQAKREDEFFMASDDDVPF